MQSSFCFAWTFINYGLIAGKLAACCHMLPTLLAWSPAAMLGNSCNIEGETGYCNS